MEGEACEEPLIPVVQLYARDVPGLPFPEGTDVLQVLWLPVPDLEGCWPAEFTFRDPVSADKLRCGECGGSVEALLTVGPNERGAGGGSWAALELQAMVDADPGVGLDVYRPTKVEIGRGYALQFYYCLTDPRHLPRTIMQ